MCLTDNYENGFDEDVLQNEYNTCPECGGRVTTSRVETACDECGLVLCDSPTDYGPEWRDDDATRVGAPRTVTRHDRGLSTEIGSRFDARGRPLSAAKQRQLARFRNQQTKARFQGSATRNEASGLEEIARLCGALDLSHSYREQASVLFQTAQEDSLLSGRSIEGIAAGCVYAVCRIHGLPRSIEEVAAHSSMDATDVSNGYRVLNTHLDLPGRPPDPRGYVDRLVSEFDLDDAVRVQAVELVEAALDAGLDSGRHPGGMAAGAVYAVLGRFGPSQQALAEAAGVTPPTLRARWRELRTFE